MVNNKKIKKGINYYFYGWFSGILPICSKQRIEEILNATYQAVLNLGPMYITSLGEITGCVRDVIFNQLTPEEQDNLCYAEVNRFLSAHKQTYERAFQEVKNGKKETHWMWWIFPQMKGLGTSERSEFYGISDRNEARIFLRHPILGNHLREITQAVLDNKNTPYEIFGNDTVKFHSCMLLFASVDTDKNSVFKKVCNKYCWK